MEKVSLVVTVRNEEASIGALLDALSTQTRSPDECIIVDGGSTDATVARITAYTGRLPVRIVQPPHGDNYSIAQGRNVGIRESRFDIIAVTDAGCIPEVDWCERLTAPFADRRIDAVAGYYTPTGTSVFQRCLGTYTSVMPDALDTATYLPSSRSIAFRKHVWTAVGGYPEHLVTAEDLVFARRIREQGHPMVIQAGARVAWPQARSMRAAAYQFYRYARGDGQALYIRRQTPFLILRTASAPFILLYGLADSRAWVIGGVAVLISIYIAYAVMKNYRYVRRWQALYYLPLLQVVSDYMVLCGMTIGFVERMFARKYV